MSGRAAAPIITRARSHTKEQIMNTTTIYSNNNKELDSSRYSLGWRRLGSGGAMSGERRGVDRQGTGGARWGMSGEDSIRFHCAAGLPMVRTHLREVF
jgi:hypothetical protein